MYVDATEANDKGQHEYYYISTETGQSANQLHNSLTYFQLEIIPVKFCHQSLSRFLPQCKW